MQGRIVLSEEEKVNENVDRNKIYDFKILWNSLERLKNKTR